MKSREFVIKNTAGIHCRPSGVILSTIKKEFPDDVFTVKSAEGETGLDSILALISLGLVKGAHGTLCVEGPNEEAAVKKIGDLFEFEFDFPQD